MSQSVVTKYVVYHDAEKIQLEEIVWESKETCNPSLTVRVLIDGRIIKNVTFKRDIASKAYAIPPFKHGAQSSGHTILFGGMVQAILDRFADFILPPMKPLGVNPITGETLLNAEDRTDIREIENTRQKIERHQFTWKKLNT